MTKSKYLLTLSITLILSGCSTQYDYVSADQFIGTWELVGRKMFNGIQVDITREEGKVRGKVTKLNDNKYVRMLAEEGDLWVSEINRSSDFQFRLTENKIGRELFSLYGLSTSTVLKAEFIHKDTIGLTSGSGDPLVSTVRYIRVK